MNDDSLTVNAQQRNELGGWLRPGDALPFFDVVTVDGSHVAYKQFWQQRNVVLVSLSSETSESDQALVTTLTRRSEDFDLLQAACVMTYDAVAGVPHPGVVIADRWGEVQIVTAGLPEPQDLLETLEYLQHKCPECEGESR
jgi:hypothetical protein